MRSSSRSRRREKAPSDTLAADSEAVSPTLSPYPIYQAPTVETLDSSLLAPQQQRQMTPPLRTRASRPVDKDQTPLVKNLVLSPKKRDIQRARTPSKLPKSSTVASDLLPSSSSKPSVPTSSSSRRRRRNMQRRDFQKLQDWPSAQVRAIHLAERTAFEPLHPVSVEEWKEVAAQAEGLRKVSMRKRLSPSLQHLEMIHKMQSVGTIRQVSYSPNLDFNANVFGPWEEDDEEEVDATNEATGQRRRHRKRRDGQYRCKNPLKATLAILPETPPQLSNRKYRLPLRSDVGFPNASPAEIQSKQQEIRLETQWEEASPRLIVLIPSDDFGTAVQQEETNVDVDSKRLLDWNQGGWEGLPYAGRELIVAKERNAKHFNKTSVSVKRRKWRPDRTSMLAPPLDSTFSSTMGWRPRPFQDRPPGQVYLLASPTCINFDIGDIEPLVCSLALYTLPPDKSRLKQAAYGKMSEDMYLPAGDWEGKVSLDSAIRQDGTVDMGVLEAWHGRKHKGLFSYNPNETDPESLHVVLQVYKVGTSRGAAAPYLDDGYHVPPSPARGSEKPPRKRLSQRVKHKIGKSIRSGSIEKHEAAAAAEAATTHSASDAVFDQYGTKLLTPLCFGIAPVFGRNEKDAMKWPSGSSRSMTFHSFPSQAENQNEFVERLISITSRPRSLTPDFHARRLFTKVSSSDDDSDATPLSDSSRSKKRSIFRSTKMMRSSSAPDLPSSSPSDNKGKRGLRKFCKTSKIAGSAMIFLSELGVDFTQSMLVDPPELAVDSEVEKLAGLPRLLVDVTGDCAIAMSTSPNEALSAISEAGNDVAVKKRSNLIRLPPIPLGYVNDCDVRELQLLPPRVDKQYDVDVPTSPYSVLNLLYIYPRLLKLSSSGHDRYSRSRKKELNAYSVRIRLLRSAAEMDKDSGQIGSVEEALESFYNLVPWEGSQMLDEVYTKVHGSLFDKDGLSMRDEFKMRLPMILDGTYFLQFTLFAVFDIVGSCEESALNIESVAETMIPLSSSSNREPSSGVRVTTVIPNGCHRLKLGDCQLQFETRILSSVHVGDPTAATILRDFPVRIDTFGERIQSLALTPSRSIVGRSQSSDPVVDLKVTFQQLFASASESTLVGQFPLFVYMHLSSLVSRCRRDLNVTDIVSDRASDVDDIVSEIDGFDDNGNKFMEETMASLFELIQQVKSKVGLPLWSGDSHVSVFIKQFVDSFDDGASNLKNTRDEHDEIANTLLMGRSQSSLTGTEKGGSEELVDFELADFDGGAVRHANDSFHKDIDLRISRTLSALNAKGTPFSRVAYGASKLDRMRLEAELNQERTRFSHLMDDDETVFGSLQHGRGNDDSYLLSPSRLESGGSTWQDDDTIFDERSLLGARSTMGPNRNDEKEASGAIGLVRRVRTAAQVMIAPCVTPAMSIALNSKRGSDGSPAVGRGGLKAPKHFVTEAKKTSSVENKTVPLVLAGSGSEEDNVLPSGPKNTPSNGAIIFRGEESSSFLVLSTGRAAAVLENSHSPETDFDISHVYEAVMMVWAKVWREFKRDNVGESLLYLTGDETRDDHRLLFSFYSHLDCILPLCLKSLSQRCSEVLPAAPKSTVKVILDENHMNLQEPVVETLCHGLMSEALGVEDGLVGALVSIDKVLDFLIGLFASIHAQQVSVLLSTFFSTLRGYELESREEPFAWDKGTIHRVKCSRQLRIRAVERLAVLGSFIPLNFPCRFSNSASSGRDSLSSWKIQKFGSPENSSNPNESIIHPEGELKLPRSGWLAELLVGESLLICSLSCEAVVAEAMAHIEVTQQESSGSPDKGRQSALKQRPGKSLRRRDLLLFQSMAIHSITCVHELLLRRHAMDSRYQTEQSRARIAALFVHPILSSSLSGTRWLARMESTHTIRSLWLACLLYILQEAPESLLRALVRSYCCPSDFEIHRFIRLLRLCSSTFQSLVDEQKSGSRTDNSSLSPWLLQESFNTICAITNVVVEECAVPISAYPREQIKLVQGVLELLLHVLTVPQSAVTHLRTVGGVIQSLAMFGVEVFFEASGDNLQHWIRVMLTLMNSVSLSVRSVSVDFILSLLGETFTLRGNIEEISVLMATILPEVVAREIALYSVSGLLNNTEQVESTMWPLRRSFADLEDTNPLDDDRIDPQLSPILATLCRTCQAIIDGVLIEMRLKGDDLSVVGSRFVSSHNSTAYTFDADEESLYEAASFFPSETAPVQKLRWLHSLMSLHESKGQWVEAAETLMLCSRTISDSIPHLRTIWQPSEFVLWHDDRRSLWLGTIGKEGGKPDRGNVQVMEFAGSFLAPPLFGSESKKVARKLCQPTIFVMCNMLSTVSKEAIKKYLMEDGMEELAFSRMEALLRVVMNVVEEHNPITTAGTVLLPPGVRKRLAEEEAALRKVSAVMNSDLTKLAERLLLVTERENKGVAAVLGSPQRTLRPSSRRQYFVRVVLSGAKPARFTESTTIPTFVEWDNPCICRVPKSVLAAALDRKLFGGVAKSLESRICSAFAKSLREALSSDDDSAGSVVFRNAGVEEEDSDIVNGKTYLDISLVHMDPSSIDDLSDNNNSVSTILESKRFFYQKASSFPLQQGLELNTLLNGVATNLVELTVANPFPCPLSRQRTLITSEFMGNQ